MSLRTLSSIFRPRREVVGRLGAVLFRAEVEEAGVVAVVGLVVEIPEPAVDILAVEQRLQLAVGLDAAVFAHAEEDDAVDGALDGEVELVDGELGLRRARFLASASRQVSISFRNSASTVAVPRLPVGDGVLVEGAFEDGVLGEDGGDLVPSGQVVAIGEVENAAGAGLVGWVWANPAIVDGELLEIGEDGERQLGRPGVAAELIGGAEFVLEIDGGLLGFEEELARAADAEAVVGGFGVRRRS